VPRRSSTSLAAKVRAESAVPFRRLRPDGIAEFVSKKDGNLDERERKGLLPQACQQQRHVLEHTFTGNAESEAKAERFRVDERAL